jgi:small-conductance mechanosensitive channel
VALPRDEGSITMENMHRHKEISHKGQTGKSPFNPLRQQTEVVKDGDGSNKGSGEKLGNRQEGSIEREDHSERQKEEDYYRGLSNELKEWKQRIDLLSNSKLENEIGEIKEKVNKLDINQKNIETFASRIAKIKETKEALDKKQEKHDRSQLEDQIKLYKEYKKNSHINDDMRQICDDQVKFIEGRMANQQKTRKVKSEILFNEIKKVNEQVDSFPDKLNSSKLAKIMHRMYEEYIIYLQNKNTHYMQTETFNKAINNIEKTAKK